MKKNDFIAFSIGKNNPIIVRKDRIDSIVPDNENGLRSKVYLIDNATEYFLVEEPTSSIEGRLIR